MRKQATVIRTGQQAQRAVEAMRAMYREHCGPDGRGFVVTLAPYTPPKSTSMRNTFHMWLAEMGEQCGHSTAEMKEIVCHEFLPIVATEIRLPDGKVVTRERRRSTEDLDRAEYLELMNRTEAFAGEHGFFITQPNADERASWRKAADREQARREQAA